MVHSMQRNFFMRYTKKIVAISVFCIANQAFGMLYNAQQKREAYAQFKLGKTQKNREKFVPIILQHEQRAKANFKKFTLITAGIAAVGGVCAYGIYKCFPHFHYSQCASAFTSIIGLWASGSYGCAIMQKTANIKILQKEEKEIADWYRIQEIGREALYANTYWTSTSVKSKKWFMADESCRLVNTPLDERLEWNMQNPKCMQKVLSGRYNSSTWRLQASSRAEE